MARKSIANYVRNSMGGSKNAAQRLGAARNSSARLLNVTGIFASGGAQAVERYLSLENLSNRNATDALLANSRFLFVQMEDLRTKELPEMPILQRLKSRLK